jgi:short subunit dehydrogenase-like uncharacterized protein
MPLPKIPQDGQAVAVFGASGHTGRFVIAELLRRGLVPIAIGRDEARLLAPGFQNRAVQMRIAIVEDPASLDLALAGAAAVINCAGPFLDTAEALAAAALRARIPYLDVTAEQPSALATFEQFDAPAREAGIVLVPAMGFYGGLGDLLATATMGDWASADEIRIAIALDSWHPTPGTRMTGKRNTAGRLVIADGKLEPLPDPAPEATWTFPDPFGVQKVTELPFSETILISRHLRVSSLHTYLNLTPLRDLRDSSTPPPAPADDTRRSAQKFLVEVIVRNGTEMRRASARGRDIYAFTAPLVVEAAQRILEGKAEGRGVLAPGEMFDAPSFLRALSPDHVIFETNQEAALGSLPKR